MEIRQLEGTERAAAMELAWRVFQEFEAPDYGPEGVQTFRAYITDPAVSDLTVYGAFSGENPIGMLAVREGPHIALFFVDPAWHRQGVGRALFRRFLAASGAESVTVHSSPYAVEVYRRLGFQDTAPEQQADGIRYTPMRYRRQAGVSGCPAAPS